MQTEGQVKTSKESKRVRGTDSLLSADKGKGQDIKTKTERGREALTYCREQTGGQVRTPKQSESRDTYVLEGAEERQVSTRKESEREINTHKLESTEGVTSQYLSERVNGTHKLKSVEGVTSWDPEGKRATRE